MSVAAALMLGQQISIWNTTGGALMGAAATIAGASFLIAAFFAPPVGEVRTT